MCSPLLKKEGKNQIYVLRGEVVDSRTGELLEGAEVSICDLNHTFKKQVLTDLNGSFRIDIPKGTYVISCLRRKYFYSETYEFSTIGKNTEEIIRVKIPLTKAEIGQAYILRSIDFEVNSTNLNIKKGKDSIDKLIKFLDNNDDIMLEIGAHTDSRGNDEYNLELSKKRARSVRDYIISKGIEKHRITYRGYGEKKLLNECVNRTLCSTEKHLKNRRIEFKVISVQSE